MANEKPKNELPSDQKTMQTMQTMQSPLQLGELSGPGRPTKYTPETLEKLLAALRDGLTQKQACLASGIGESTLYDWRKEHPDLEPRMQEARETARQKALAGIKAAGEAGDWRAMEAFLKYSFHADYKRDNSVNVTATAQAAAPALVCTEEQRQRLIAQLDRIKDRPAMTTLPAQPAQLQAGVGTGNGIVEAKPEPVEKLPPDPPDATASPSFRAWLEYEKAEPEPEPGPFAVGL